jgi:hypothetical protein
MTYESMVTIAVLDKDENLIGWLNPRFVQLPETNELYKLRTLTITHPLTDEIHDKPDYYGTLLKEGNKLWRTTTTDGDSCLYVILGPVIYSDDLTSVTVTAIEAAYELGQVDIEREVNFSWIVNSTFINSVCGELFDAGTITGPTTTVAYSGALTPLAILQNIQANTGGEFQFRYEYDPTIGYIKRYIDFFTTVGTVHDSIIDVIKLGKNATKISYQSDETDVGSAAGPIGKPSGTSGNDTFHADRARFEALAYTKGQSIPLFVTKDASGNVAYGPNVAAPYAKVAGQGWVECDEESELVANYTRNQSKAGTTGSGPRIITFESSESNEITMYWNCVDKVRQHLQPNITLSTTIMDLKAMEGLENSTFNIGDVIYVNLPFRDDVVQCRITKTIKDPRKPENLQIEINTYKSTFMEDFFQSYFKSPGSIIF